MQATVEPPTSLVTPSVDDRDIRQRNIIPRDRILTTRATVIGVGAIGRQVAMSLAAIGLDRLTLIDFDTVNVENLAAQGYWPEDIGKKKVEATGAACKRIYRCDGLQLFAEKFDEKTCKKFKRMIFEEREFDQVVFCCVDSGPDRRFIWHELRNCTNLFIDGRMSAESMRILAIEEPRSDKYYEPTIPHKNDVFRGACTAQTTIYTANIAAGFMLQKYTMWLRGFPLDRDQVIDLIAGSMFVIDVSKK